MEKVLASFRDPAGYLFTQNKTLYRYIHSSYLPHYTHLLESGLYTELTTKRQLIGHTQVDLLSTDTTAKTIAPTYIPTISYPYEWSFSQLKDAALLTLDIQQQALEHGMTLKDASAFNVQFLEGAPIFIDTLSFEVLDATQPWTAYRQFCQHFLAPLALMSYTDIRLLSLFKTHLDGIPLDLASSLLPFRTKFNFSLYLHIHLHAKAQKKFERSSGSSNKQAFSLLKHRSLIDSLKSTISKLTLPALKTEWGAYYQDDSYTELGLAHKKSLIDKYLQEIAPKTVLDMGANDGLFSEVARAHCTQVISADYDPLCVENNYKRLQKNKTTGILPLLIDVTNPTPTLGWDLEERDSFTKRSKSDCVLALALIHHLAISNNLPLDYIASYLKKLGTHLIIEFVPKEDKKVQTLLQTRKDIFPDYRQEKFEAVFSKQFTVLKKNKVNESHRTLYLMKVL